jgi:hypothetical protein
MYKNLDFIFLLILRFARFQNETVKERKPCVGLCHYYRTLGIENPFEKRQIKRFPVTD